MLLDHQNADPLLRLTKSHSVYAILSRNLDQIRLSICSFPILACFITKKKEKKMHSNNVSLLASLCVFFLNVFSSIYTVDSIR